MTRGDDREDILALGLEAVWSPFMEHCDATVLPGLYQSRIRKPQASGGQACGIVDDRKIKRDFESAVSLCLQDCMGFCEDAGG